MSSSSLVRPAAFDDSDASAPKRRKLAPNEYDSENDSGDELFASIDSLPEVATLPLPPSYFNGPPANPPTTNATQSLPHFSSQANVGITQPTQILSPTPDGRPPSAYFPPVVQVPASSPLPSNHSSPPRSQPPVPRPALQPDGSVRPFNFYPAPNGTASFSRDGPQYIAPSSDGEGSDNDIKPAFAGSNARVRETPSKSTVSPMEYKVEESPISLMKNLGQYAYNANTVPVPSSGKRLDSLNRRTSFSPTTRVATGIQSRPERAQPVGKMSIEDIQPPEYRHHVERMRSVLPNKPTAALVNALIQKRGNYDDAIEMLTASESDMVIDLTSNESASAKVKTLNRAQGAGRVNIRDKWSSTQVVHKSPTLASSAVDNKLKRKLVRGSAALTRSESPRAPVVIDDDSDSAAELDDDSEDEHELERRVLTYINVCTVKELSDIACTGEDIAEVIISQRPFKSLDDVRGVSTNAGNAGKGKKGRGTRTRAVGDKVVDVCLETMRGYEAVDSLIARVEDLGKPIAESIKAWGVDIFGGSDAGSGELEITDINVDADTNSIKDSGIGTPTSNTGTADDGEDVKAGRRDKHGQFLKVQPKNMGEGVVLKDYQLVGVSWLNLLYEKNLSCILADEMGLGKTCQVVAFLTHLLAKGITGPHLIVVPSSTLENWLREFATFSPALKVEPYYGSQAERPAIRTALMKDRSWNVLVTTYQLATGDRQDRAFLKNLAFNVCVYDEGHMLKNSNSHRHDTLMKLPADFRLLLTGTPLQNNLQELASLLAFILPNVFNEKRDELQSIFKYKAKTTNDDESNNALLSVQRIKRARAMMTPFVLRRKKQQVLKHLPGKTNRVEYCKLNKLQSDIYHENIASAKEAIVARAAGKKPTKSTSNVMMQLRKAAIHPLLFRTYFTDEKIRKMAKDIMKEEAYRSNDQAMILEDMEVMNDLELHRLCENFPKTLGKFGLKKNEWMNSGKIDAIKQVLLDMRDNGDRVLLFSQFTQMLDILELVLTTLGLGFLRIDGSTPVEMRQDLIDQYHQEEDIMVFLLSTKAGGFGINLACANKVVIFDSSFNPHDDVQASDRAHRVGQKREVEVIRLVTRHTIEEQILQLANTKLALDQSISADEKALEGKGEEMVAQMLLQSGDGPITNGEAAK